MILDLVLALFCLGLLGCSAFFSGSETALFALGPRQRHLLRKRADRPARRAAVLLDELGEVLVTVLMGNTWVNILFAVFTTRLFIRQLGTEQGAAVGGAAATVLVVLFGEILPKSLAVRDPLPLSLRLSPLLLRVHRLLHPLALPLKALSRGVQSWLQRLAPADDLELREEDMLALFSIGVEDGSLADKEHELVRGVFELGDVTVREVMRPRVDCFLLDAATPAAEAAWRLRKARYSQAPVYTGDPDHVTGMITVSDLLPRDREATPIGGLAAPPRFCPESQRAGALLQELLAEGRRMAVVLDEYGALAGLTTREDLYEVLVGEILNRRTVENQRFSMPDERTLIATSRLELARIEELLGVALRSETAETLGGYLMEAIGEVPAPGASYTIGPLRWTVVSARGPALRTLRLERLP